MLNKRYGFTIVELLIVIVVIAILASISVVAYNGVQNRSKNSATQTALKQVQKLVEAYNAANGSYPSTGSLDNVYIDANCPFPADDTGQKTATWVPGIETTSSGPLPLSNFSGTGRSNVGGCYAYSSNGTTYVLTAWNAKYGGPSTDAMYRRLGFREQSWFYQNQYYCNHMANIGGNLDNTYDINEDYYKFSYTLSNVTNCNEAPPTGA